MDDARFALHGIPKKEQGCRCGTEQYLGYQTKKFLKLNECTTKWSRDGYACTRVKCCKDSVSLIDTVGRIR